MLETLIPLYCLTGFVGSGKTTALLSILRQNPDKKIGVIFTEPPLLHRQNIQENEDISIEMLDNGSLQCSCSEDALAQALAYMHRCQPEMVFVEVSGLSDPVHVKKILESEENAGLMQHYAVQGIICLIDADNFMEQIQDVEMVGRQLCHCHLAVINKADLVAPELLGMLKAQIHRINPDCDIVSCSYGGFSLELLEHDLLEPVDLEMLAEPHRFLSGGGRVLLARWGEEIVGMVMLELQGKGVIRISSSALGKSMGLTASQIRQDLFCFGEFGQQGYGYKVDLLREEIGEILGISHRSGTGGRQPGPGPDGKLQVRQQRLPAPGRFRRGRERGGHHHRRSERVPCGPAGGVSVGPQGQRGPAHPAPEGGPGGGRPAGGRGSPGDLELHQPGDQRLPTGCGGGKRTFFRQPADAELSHHPAGGA